jgi:hypothetical protein
MEQPMAHDGPLPIQLQTPVEENTLKLGGVEIGQKSFVFALKANAKGRFLRITEKSGNAYVGLIIPGPGLEIFREMLGKIFRAANQPPSEAKPVAGHILKIEQVRLEKKNFVFKLEQPPDGRHVSIAENSGGRCSRIVIPADGIEAFWNLLDEMVKVFNESLPAGHTAKKARPGTHLFEHTLKLGQMRLDRRSITFALKKNLHGRFLRIATEENEGHYNNIIIPAEGLEEFKTWVVEMAEASKKLDE